MESYLCYNVVILEVNIRYMAAHQALFPYVESPISNLFHLPWLSDSIRRRCRRFHLWADPSIAARPARPPSLRRSHQSGFRKIKSRQKWQMSNTAASIYWVNTHFKHNGHAFSTENFMQLRRRGRNKRFKSLSKVILIHLATPEYLSLVAYNIQHRRRTQSPVKIRPLGREL
jgi:hypothetical protein